MMRRHTMTSRHLRTVTTLALVGLVATALSAVPAQADQTVGCSTADLVTAITNANASTADPVINLDPYCVYEVSTAASADDGLPPITLAAGITLNGNNATIKRIGSNQFRLLDVASGGKLTVNDLTVTNGNPSSNIGGGAILVQGNGTFIGHNLTVQGNTGNIGGGMRARPNSSLTLTDSRFEDNRTSGGASTGGGLAVESTTATLTNVDFTRNRARLGGALYERATTFTSSGGSARFNTSGDEGGGLFFEAGTATVTGMTVADNRSATGANQSSGGGGVWVSGGSVTLQDSVISGNKVTGSGLDVDGGGGALVNGGSLTLVNTQVVRNQVIGQASIGGGINIMGGTLNVTDGSTISRNVVSGAYSKGGGINSTNLFSPPTVTVSDSSVDLNQALGTGSFAAGVANSGGTFTFTNASVSNNSAPQSTGPGGIWTDVAITAVTGSTFTGNSPTNCLRSPQPVSTCSG
ncbi:hypothetical protein ACFQ8S_22730 [Streptomyces virginiae]|uniref:hypothetical protein n=1 Tax=Streptomyces virginiae TaxID=1961 RepID=UPI0036B1E15B